MEIKIREEQKKDYKTVEEIVEMAFRDEAFSDHQEHFLVGRLRRSDAFVPELSLVAEVDGEIIGHIMLTKARIVSEGQPATTLVLAPVSVHPRCQKLGIGSALIREAHRRAAGLGYLSAVLLGHKDYYPKFGYKKAADFGIRFPFDVAPEFCMAVELQPGGLAGVHGMVEFARPFME